VPFRNVGKREAAAPRKQQRQPLNCEGGGEGVFTDWNQFSEAAERAAATGAAISWGLRNGENTGDVPKLLFSFWGRMRVF